MSIEPRQFQDVHVELVGYSDQVSIWWHGQPQPDRRASLMLASWYWHHFKADEHIEPGVGPSLQLTGAQAKVLMTAMWNAGVRPAVHDRDPNAQIAAIQYHLEDMRALLFGTDPRATIKGVDQRWK